MVRMKMCIHRLGSLFCVMGGMSALSATASDGVLETGNAKTNLALGSKASSALCFSAEYGAPNVVDGDFSTRWASPDMKWPLGESSSGDVSLVIDLCIKKKFNQVVLHESAAWQGRIERVTVEVSDDGVKWERWAERRPNGALTSMVGETVSKRYLKVDFPDYMPDGINVDEVEVYYDLSAKPTEEPLAWRSSDSRWIVQQPSLEPTVYQVRKKHLKYGMFIHYGMNTFLGKEWSDGTNSPSCYHPDWSGFDADAWVKTAYEGGMNFVVLVTKHHDGFALWNTEVGTYNINHTGRAEDRFDIVKAVSDACRKYGIKLGLYYSIWDRNWDLHHTCASTGLDPVSLGQKYNDFALAQISELLDGRYGEISELWIDGAWVKPNAAWEFARLYDTVKRLQPTCQMAVNTTIRGCAPDKYKGGEELFYFPTDFRLQDPMFTRRGTDADPKIYRHQGKEYFLPFEATICINSKGWFWNEGCSAETVMSATDIKNAYEHMTEQGNTLVLNMAPDKGGRFSSFDVDGCYAGARALGIARGEARLNPDKDEKAVRIDYVTTKGYVAFPTHYLYGKKGGGFTVKAEDLSQDGYRFVGKEEVVEGRFGKTKRIEFVYEDVAGSLASGKSDGSLSGSYSCHMN